MSTQTFILLYSKYSARCKRFLELMNQYSMDFIDTICVDNKDLRRKVQNSIYKISSVPCLLVFYNSTYSNVEKYEDEHAFSWLDEIIKKKMREMTTYGVGGAPQAPYGVGGQPPCEAWASQAPYGGQQPPYGGGQVSQPVPMEATLIHQPLDETQNVTQLASFTGQSMGETTAIHPPNGGMMINTEQQMQQAQQKVSEAVRKSGDITSKAQEMQKARELLEPPKPPGMR